MQRSCVHLLVHLVSFVPSRAKSNQHRFSQNQMHRETLASTHAHPLGSVIGAVELWCIFGLYNPHRSPIQKKRRNPKTSPSSSLNACVQPVLKSHSHLIKSVNLLPASFITSWCFRASNYIFSYNVPLSQMIISVAVSFTSLLLSLPLSPLHFFRLLPYLRNSESHLQWILSNTAAFLQSKRAQDLCGLETLKFM